MLPRARRVPKGLFPLIIKQGRSWHSPTLSIRILRQTINTDSPSLFSVVARSKVSSGAVERNYFKRRARSVLIKLMSHIKDNYYCLLFLKPEVKKLSYSQLEQTIIGVLKSAHLLSDELNQNDL